jgi:hypothetical protein
VCVAAGAPATRVFRLLAFLLLSAGAACAQELRPGPLAPPRVGDRARVTWVETSSVSATRTVRGSSAPDEVARETRLEASWTEEVAAVETRGGELRPAEVKLDLERLTRRDAGRESPPIAPRTVVLHPLLVGDARVDASGGPALPPGALAFLERVADRLRACPYDAALLPESARKVGQTWRPAKVDDLVFDAAFVDVDDARSESQCTLRGLAERADVRLVARLRLLTVPGTRARVDEGGDYQLEAVASFVPGERPSRGRIAETATFEARAHDQLPDGTPFELTTRAHLETTIEVTRTP